MKTTTALKTKRIVAMVFLPILISLVFFWTGCERSGGKASEVISTPTRPVKIMVVEAANVDEIRAFPGIAKAVRETDLAFRVGGPLIEYDLNIGQEVSKGDVIARIDPRDFENRVKKLTAELKVAKAQLADAERDFERQKNLLVENAASQDQYDNTKMLLETTQAGIESLMTDLESAQNALSDTRLVAPFDGVVNRKYTENYETVASGMPVISLLDISTIEVATTIPEDIVIREADVAEIYATLDVHPDRKITASLKEIGRQTDNANQSYPMTINLQMPKTMAVTPGMAASVYLVLRNPKQANSGIYLPTVAVFSDAAGETCVWRVKKDSLDTEKVKVETGPMRGNEILVTSGIQPGDRLVSAGARFLVEGQKIRILGGSKGTAS